MSKTAAPKKKRVTIAQLEAIITHERTALTRMTVDRDQEADTRRKYQDKVRELERATETAERVQRAAERQLHELRAAVLEYFQIMANAHTANDRPRIQRVQGMISGFMTSEAEPVNTMQPVPRGGRY